MWYGRHGFPSDRLEWATAIGATYVGSVWGGKAKAAELLPKFESAAVRTDAAAVASWFRAREKKGS